MASPSRKSGIPIMKAGKTQIHGSSSQLGFPSSRSSGIPRRVKTGDTVKPLEGPTVTSPNKEENDVKKQVALLEEDAKIKDATIEDLNDKLVERMRECQTLREEKEVAMDIVSFSNQEDSMEVEKLKKHLQDKEDYIQKMDRNKAETERKFEVELDMLKNQHEINVLSLQQRLEDTHEEKRRELETSLQNQKKVSGELREELSRVCDEGRSAEVNQLKEELMSTKLRYEDVIHELREKLKNESDEKDRGNTEGSTVTRHDDVVVNGNAEDFVGSAKVKLGLKFEKELKYIKKTHSEELETLKYMLQEKDIQIADLTQRVNVTKISEDGPSITEDSPSTVEGKAYSHEQVAAMLDELREKLSRECDLNIAMANDLWRSKFEEEQESNGVKQKVHEETTIDDEDVSDDHRDFGSQAKEVDARKLMKEISDLKIQLEEAIELGHEQAELLEIQEKEMEELKESNREFEERYNVLFKDMESKWREEFNESDIIERIKGHYEMEIERLHGDLEEFQTESSNLKTELDLMASDFDGGYERRNGIGGAVRKNSVSARLDLKAEVEDYKVQLASLERDLQHVLNQNERLKMEHNMRGNGGEDSGTQHEIDALHGRITEFQQETQTLTEERDAFRIKLENNKREKKRIEKDLGSRKIAEAKVEKELEKKCEEMAALEKRHGREVKGFEEQVAQLKTTLNGMDNGRKAAEAEVASLEESDAREKNLSQTIEEFKRKGMEIARELQEAKSEREEFQARVNELLPIVKEYDRLKEKYDETVEQLKDKEIYNRELGKSEERFTELETILRERKKECEALKEKYEKLDEENKTRDSVICELETTLSQRKTDHEELNDSCQKLKAEDETKRRKIDELEIKLSERQADFEELKVACDKLKSESETKAYKIRELESTLSKSYIECEELKVHCDTFYREKETSTSGISELETTLNEKKLECEELNVTCEKLKSENEIKTADNDDQLERENETNNSRIGELETTLNEKIIEYKELKVTCEELKRINEIMMSDNDELKRENVTNNSRTGELETTLNEYKELKVTCDKLKIANETKTAGHAELKTKLTHMETEHESLKEEHEEMARENETKSSSMRELENEGGRIRKQVMIFEKRLASQEREKKSLAEKNRSLRAQVDELEKEISRLNNRCESHDLVKDELGEKLESLENTRETMVSYEQRNKELAALVEEMSREKKTLLNKQQQLIKENTDELINDRDRLVNEMEALEGTLEQERSEQERKLNGVERKVKEKDRVLAETKKQSKRLKETLKEMEERCTDLQGEIETMNEDRQKGSKKLRELLDNAKKGHSAMEKELTEELVKQRDQFESELVVVKENTRQTNQIEVAEIIRELQEKLELGYTRDLQGIREETDRLHEENYALKIQVDNLAIEVSKEKEEKYKLEKLKDQFRFEVQNLQQNVEVEREKLLQVQNEHLKVSKAIGEDKEKVMAALSEYESKNVKLISNIERASNALTRTKDKYGKLREKYTGLSKKYAKVNGEKMNKSDVQVGPDDTVDLSQIMEDLHRSQEETEEANCKLRGEMERLRAEMARGHYQIKAVRKANVVLMKQSRCLYRETEESRRAQEERSRELETSRKLNETLAQEKGGLERERKVLENRVRELERAKEQSEGYFMANNKTQIAFEEKSRECATLGRKLEKIREENVFLHRQGKKLQSQLENVENQRVGSQVSTSVERDENPRNVFPNGEFDVRESKYNNLSNDVMQTSHAPRDLDGERFSATASRMSDYTTCQSGLEDAPRHSTPVLFNNVKKDEEKVTDEVDKNVAKTWLLSTTTRNPSKDRNLQISRNLMDNEFVTEKYLGSTYWETLEFLKKK